MGACTSIGAQPVYHTSGCESMSVEEWMVTYMVAGSGTCELTIMQRNLFGEGGARGLARALEHNPCITHLDVEVCWRTEPRVQCVGAGSGTCEPSCVHAGQCNSTRGRTGACTSVGAQPEYNTFECGSMLVKRPRINGWRQGGTCEH